MIAKPALLVGFAWLAIVGFQRYDDSLRAPRLAREQESFDRATKMPTDPVARAIEEKKIKDRTDYMVIAAQYVDAHFSWKADAGGDDAKAEPSATLKQLESLATQLGKKPAYEHFVRETRYRWIATNQPLSKIKSVAQLRAGETAQLLVINAHLMQLEWFLEKVQKPTQKDFDAALPSYPLVKKMLDERADAIKHFQIGVGNDAVPTQATQTKAQ